MPNLSYLINQTNPVGIGGGLNAMSGGLFGVMLLIVIYAISFSLSIKWGARTAFASASIIGVVAAMFLRLMGWLTNDIALFLAIVLVAGAALMRYLEGRQG